MFDVITFGSATRDTFLRLKKGNYRVLEEQEIGGEQQLCFPLGAKIFIEDMHVASGGGASNVAATLAEQGFKAACCTKVGSDKRGEAVIEELKKFNVETKLIKKDKDLPTAYSAILSIKGERTILLYQGACHFFKKEDIAKNELRAKWFYVAPLSGESANIFEFVIGLANHKNIKVAANLGQSQINLGERILRPLIPQINLLILNKKEASFLTGKEEENEKEIIKKLASWGSRLVVLTKGGDGSLVFDGKYIFEAGVPSILPFEKTGAGDAYGGGFLAGLLRKKDIEYAIQLATANATACIQKIGAKNGLLKKGEWGGWPKVKVSKKLL